MASGEFLGSRPIVTHGTVTLPRTSALWPTRMKIGSSIYEVPRDISVERLHAVYDELVIQAGAAQENIEDAMGFMAAFTASFMATQPAREN